MNRPICGAKNRQGNPCGKSPLRGKNRCALHGGKTPTGTKGNRKHGIYSDAMTADELEIWPEIISRLGTVDEEIHVIRLQLRRALICQQKVQEAPADLKNLAGVEITEIRRSNRGDDGPIVDVISKRADYHAIIDRLSGRLANLERTRAELLAAARDTGENTTDKARDFTETLKAMRDTEQRNDGQ
jgi:hypothetical protein